MAESFAPRLDILPLPQQRLWLELAEVPSGFVLYGGTARALHLGHRASFDFDFFSDKPLEAGQLVPAIPFLANATVTPREPNAFSCLVDRGGAVNLAAAKASVVQQRAEAKDYLDIDALLTHGVHLPTILAAGRAVHGTQFNPQSTLKALSYFEDGNLHRLPQPVKDRLAKAARDVDLDRLPVLQASARAPNRARGPSP